MRIIALMVVFVVAASVANAGCNLPSQEEINGAFHAGYTAGIHSSVESGGRFRFMVADASDQCEKLRLSLLRDAYTAGVEDGSRKK